MSLGSHAQLKHFVSTPSFSFFLSHPSWSVCLSPRTYLPLPITLSYSQENRCKEECPVHIQTDTYVHTSSAMPAPAPPFPHQSRTCGQSMQNISLCSRGCSVFKLRSKYSLSSMWKSEQWSSQKKFTTTGNRVAYIPQPTFRMSNNCQSSKQKHLCAWGDLLLERYWVYNNNVNIACVPPEQNRSHV